MKKKLFWFSSYLNLLSALKAVIIVQIWYFWLLYQKTDAPFQKPLICFFICYVLFLWQFPVVILEWGTIFFEWFQEWSLWNCMKIYDFYGIWVNYTITLGLSKWMVFRNSFAAVFSSFPVKAPFFGLNILHLLLKKFLFLENVGYTNKNFMTAGLRKHWNFILELI